MEFDNSNVTHRDMCRIRATCHEAHAAYSAIQCNGYFGGPLSLSFSSPLFRSLFRYVRLSRTCLFLPRCSLQLLWRTLTLPLVDADTGVFVELR